MNHGEFKEVWSRALREVDLPSFVARDINETLDLRTLARTCESYVEPLGGQDAEPFNVTCAFSWVAPAGIGPAQPEGTAHVPGSAA